MKTKEKVKDEILQLLKDKPSIDLMILYTQVPEFRVVHELMETDESIQGYSIGLVKQTHVQKMAGKWLILCTNRRIIFISKGPFSKGVHFNLALGQIDFIKHKKGWLFGEMHITGNFPSVEIYQMGKADYTFFIESIRPVFSSQIML